jgi:NAD(P)-dependent dehydrogenase (short-subunit alcohol dehydrogenase family)
VRGRLRGKAALVTGAAQGIGRASHSFAVYNASKAAVWLFSKSVALHYARKGWDIRCNSIHPTFIKTPILDSLIGEHDEATVLARLALQVPIGRAWRA